MDRFPLSTEMGVPFTWEYLQVQRVEVGKVTCLGGPVTTVI